jgi:hypothetical protein
MKMILTALIVCLLAVSGNAQIHKIENVPISFYGKVVDQEGKPVIGAKVSFDFIISHMAENRTETTPMIMQTDQDGRFLMTGVTGYGIDKVSIEKEGYELSPKTSTGYVFGFNPDYKPNPNNPMVFKMWKKRGKEPLVGSAWHGKVACDGAAHRFDLSNGHPSADGNFEITCLRTPVNLPPANIKPYTYKFQITVIGGGIQATDDEFTYLAPETGYSPTLTYGQTADDPKWDRRTPIPKEYYIKTANGHYGRLSADWDVAFWQSPMILKWDCSINPSGSRNLER